MRLEKHQEDAIKLMHNGCILCGGVGSGKSITGLAYYFMLNGGVVPSETDPGRKFHKMDKIQDLYIITTAKKRDSREWESDMIYFHLHTDPDVSGHKCKVVVDSWNNIKKYVGVENAFFIFDEQRVVGYGTWSKSFIKIAKSNNWVLLTATPGDTWSDYAPVFIANGFYRNITEFRNEHEIGDRFNKWKKRYIGLQRLMRLRNLVLVDMDYHAPATAHHMYIISSYNPIIYKMVMKDRLKLDGTPIENISQLCYELRKVSNADPSRAKAVLDIFNNSIGRAIIFYNYDYELDILKNMEWGDDVVVAEWNGHRHEEVPESDHWVYLVQYNAGAEGWNCIKTDTIIFFSATYSYKQLVQAAGRINRLNSPFQDLYYYHLRSNSNIDNAIHMALKKKKKFNETKFIGG